MRGKIICSTYIFGQNFEMMHKYNDIVEYMYSKLPMYQRQGRAAYKKDLTNVVALCEALGNPHDHMKFVHIAGTNGKGSTSHLLAGMLQLSGYKTGLFVSPHYKDLRERVKVDGIMIDKKFIVDFISEHKKLIEKINPSFFELNFVLALVYFQMKNVDIAVIEVGLGGRLDSTNVITPLLSVITNISFDHKELLGDTLEEIAGEKAGIIKNSVPVVIGEYQEDVHEVFEVKAKELNAPLYFSKELVNIKKIKESLNKAHYQLQFIGEDKMWNFETSIIGPYQNKNIATSLAAIKVLSKQMSIDFHSIFTKFQYLGKLTGLIGRWQILAKQPLILVDSAHNEAGLQFAITTIQEYECEVLHMIIGFVSDKDLSNILSLMPTQAKYYFCKADIPRGLDAKILKEKAAEYHLKGRAYSSVKNAFSAARKAASERDIIFVGGSIFVAAEVI